MTSFHEESDKVRLRKSELQLTACDEHGQKPCSMSRKKYRPGRKRTRCMLAGKASFSASKESVQLDRLAALLFRFPQSTHLCVTILGVQLGRNRNRCREGFLYWVACLWSIALGQHGMALQAERIRRSGVKRPGSAALGLEGS